MSATERGQTNTPDEAGAGLVARFEGLGLPACRLDGAGVVQEWGDGLTDVLGWTAHEVVGKEPVAFGVAATEAGPALKVIQQVADGRRWHGRFPVSKKDGSRLSAWWLAIPLAAPADRWQGAVFVMLGTDDDEGRDDDGGNGASPEFEEAEQANLLLDAVLTNAPVALAILDRDLRYVRANRALAEVNGISAEEHVGRRITEVVKGMPEEALADMRKVFETGQPVVGRRVLAETTAQPGVAREWQVGYYPIALRGEVRWVGAVVLEETERRLLLEAEQSARRQAERTAEQLTRLQSMTALLSAANSQSDVCSVLVDQGVAGVGATTAVLCLLSADGTTLDVVRSVGLRPETEENWAHFPLDAPVPACDAVRTGKLVLFSNLEERDRLYPVFSGAPTRNQAFATVPVMVGRTALGAVTFGWEESREFTAEDKRFLTALAEQCGQALERCRLAEADARQRMRKDFVAEAGRVLSSSLDYEITIERVARLLLPELADACAVHVTTGDRLEMVTVAHVDRVHEKLLRDLTMQDDDLAHQLHLHEVSRSRRPLLVESIAPDVWTTMATDNKRRVQLQRLGLMSGLAVPLVASGQSLGVLSMAMSVSGRRYTKDDVAVAQDIADRAAVAIHNARTHRAMRDVARTLQRSLLPSTEPAIPGLDVAAVYHPVSESEVGGDFFDVFAVGPGKWGVVIGDVCGKGVPAASLTALARYTVRAVGVGNDSPAAVLLRLNQAVLDEGMDDRFCTIAYLVVEPGEGQAKVTLACGGHPLPYLVDRAGDLRTVGRPGGGIGMFPDPDLIDTVHVLNPGESLVLYTDGVLEARSPDGEFAPDLFVEALGKAAAAGDGADAKALAQAVESAVLAFEGGTARDDMAVLVLRVPPPA
ncbi:MAG: hypothetical protein QOI20_1481 [Acidimicrobiaceae bacterium]|jgi:serine phosphatase RsbU (regulator of sigma subunit)/PAS domain-containing protein|nr:hypothetical protein [Acidimicrobiaceae bacterium]